MALLDGELVVENENGASDFSALQADLAGGKSDRFVLYLFDLLHLDGVSLRNAQLVDRKNVLKQIVGDGSRVLRYSDHFDADGDLVLQHACRLSLRRRYFQIRRCSLSIWPRQELVQVEMLLPSRVCRRRIRTVYRFRPRGRVNRPRGL